jgi:hypothetical protein
MRSERTAALHSYTCTDIFKMAAFWADHICSGSQIVCACFPFATLNSLALSSFPEVSNTDRTACLNPGDDGQRLMVIAANPGWTVPILTVPFAQLPGN